MNPPTIDRALDCCTADELPAAERLRIEAEMSALRDADTEFAHWAAGYSVVRHDALTQWRVQHLLLDISQRGPIGRRDVLAQLAAADRLASAGLWLVAHLTYAARIRCDGVALAADDFKSTPEGHTGGSLNMVPAYVGYLLANALSGHTRGWLMGQGHCVAAIDAVNVLIGNTTPAHAARYACTDEGLTRMAQDFYAYRIRPDGTPESPLGSHVNAHTAGGMLEGGYLGFAELLYPHIPLPGERLVAFLSDGAFEEQRGSDWASRWWRPEDCGLVTPIMILNGRRIEQRSSIAQDGGERWLHRHLRLNDFDPIGLDGRDPASIAWGILESETRATAQAQALAHVPDLPIRLAYGVAEAPKGYGFPGAGTNAAHNLPLGANPAHDDAARERFNDAAKALWVAPEILAQAVATLSTHGAQKRPRERDHALAHRDVPTPALPAPRTYPVGAAPVSPMDALDDYFLEVVRANPNLRVRVGNPDELRSNRLDHSLDALKHRAAAPEAGLAEARTGAVITALNEEAVICAALGNKGGLNIAVTYEAFAVKMLGALRQEIIFARHQAQAGAAPRWLSVPLVLTSHTWENAKNEQSHQDPTLAEALLGEMADTSRVLFPADANMAGLALQSVYGRHGTIATLVVPKRAVPVFLAPEQAESAVRDGVVVVAGRPEGAQVLLVACGAYQLAAAQRAYDRLSERGVHTALVYLFEPARLREPRDAREATVVVSDAQLAAWFPPKVPRVIVTHTRPEPFLGALRRIDTGPATTLALGYRNRGGTLDVDGLLFANGCTWAHVAAAAAQVLGRAETEFLDDAQWRAIHAQADPAVLWQ